MYENTVPRPASAKQKTKRCLRGTRKIARSVVDLKCKDTESTREKTSSDE